MVWIGRRGTRRKEEKILVYQWKLPGLYSVPAQTAGDELDRIYQDRGKLDASDVVDESRPEEAVLHPCFEWDDPKAAELYREQQARNLINCIVVSTETADHPKTVQAEVKAFSHVHGTYHPMYVVVNDEEKYVDMLESALRDLRTFQKRYAAYANRPELKAIFNAIDLATA